jgi:hypothetical protein
MSGNNSPAPPRPPLEEPTSQPSPVPAPEPVETDEPEKDGEEGDKD